MSVSKHSVKILQFDFGSNSTSQLDIFSKLLSVWMVNPNSFGFAIFSVNFPVFFIIMV